MYRGAAESTHRALAALFRCRAFLDKARNEKTAAADVRPRFVVGPQGLEPWTERL